MKCFRCGEPSEWHLLIGVQIPLLHWHIIFSGKGRELKPSEGMPYVRQLRDLAELPVVIPAPRKPPPRDRKQQAWERDRGRRGRFIRGGP